jgi:hypothetical protein
MLNPGVEHMRIRLAFLLSNAAEITLFLGAAALLVAGMLGVR